MGRAMCLSLAKQGCFEAMGDLKFDAAKEARRLAEAEAPSGVRVTTFRCDVCKEPPCKTSPGTWPRATISPTAVCSFSTTLGSSAVRESVE